MPKSEETLLDTVQIVQAIEAKGRITEGDG